MTQEQVECILKEVNVRKAMEPDDVTPQVLWHCVSELAGPLLKIFIACVQEKTWPFDLEGDSSCPKGKLQI